MIPSAFALLISLLFLASFAGIAFVVAGEIYMGARYYSGEYTADTARQFEDVFLFIPPERIRLIAWGSAGVCCVAGFLLAGGGIPGAVAALLAGLAAFFAPRRLLAVMRAKRLLRFNLQLVDALINMSNALRAGFSITQAFEAAAKEGQNPIAQEFSVLLQQVRVGVRFEDALVNLENRVKSEDLSLMIRSIEIARLTGGNLTEVFDKIASTIRERMRIEGRIRSLTAMGKLQGIVVGAMPILLCFAILAIDPDMMRSFINSRIGMIVLFAAAIMEVVGALIIRKIVKIEV